MNKHETQLIRMKPRLQLDAVFCAAFFAFAALTPTGVRAGDANPPPPRISTDRLTNGQPRLTFPYPAAQQYEMLSAGNVTNVFTPDTTSGKFLGPTWIVTNGGPLRFYKVRATPMSSNDLFSATVLNRLTYGPTPDDIDHIRAVGPQQFINEQLAFDSITDSAAASPAACW